jgi:colicin import membrane protein
MLEFVKVHWQYLFGAVLLHALFAGIFTLMAVNWPREVQHQQLAIEAVIVDPSVIAQAGRKQQLDREREQARAREVAEAKRRREQEEEARQQAEQRAEQERQAETKRREEEALRLKQEEQVMLERKEAERKREAEAQRQRQVEAERKRVADIERRQKEEAERRKQAEEAKARAARENELREQLEAEEGAMQARSSSAMIQYMAMIQQHVQRRWIRPPSARPGIECEVKVAQSPSGTVLSVSIGRCNGDQAVQQSIETAVQRASPLPLPQDQRLWDRNLVFQFKPAD